MKPVAAIGLALALAAGAGAWLLFGTNDGEDAPPAGAGSNTAAPHPHADGTTPVERTPVPGAPNEPAAAAADPASSASRPSPLPEAETAPGNVVLVVRALATKAPVDRFRWRVRAAGQTQRGDGSLGRAELALAPATHGELLVEADGFAPFAEPELATPAAGAPPLQVDVFLAPAATATGITLQVHDTANQPLAQIRVDAHPLRQQDRDGGWHLSKPLWSRRTAAADGRYVLPELAAGEYGIRVLAVDEQGELLPLLPFARTFALTGSNGFVEDVTLEAACLPVFEFVDGAGQPFDAKDAAVMLSLHLPGGPAIRRRWLQKRDGKLVSADDELPGAGPCWPAEPVAAGAWTLEVHKDGQLLVQRPLMLRAGERQTERIVVP